MDCVGYFFFLPSEEEEHRAFFEVGVNEMSIRPTHGDMSTGHGDMSTGHANSGAGLLTLLRVGTIVTK